MTTTEITVEQREKLEVETRDFVARATTIAIKNEIDNTQAATLTAALKGEIKRRKGILAPTKAALDASKAAYKGLVDLLITPMESSVDIITQKIGAFVQAENARRAELQAIEDAKVAALQAKEDERVAKLQAKAEAAGKPAPDIAPKIIPQRVVAAVTAPAGTTYTTYWSAKVTDIKALCAAVAAGTVDDIFVTGNQTALNGHAKIKRIEGEILPGVVGVKTMGTSQRS